MKKFYPSMFYPSVLVINASKALTLTALVVALTACQKPAETTHTANTDAKAASVTMNHDSTNHQAMAGMDHSKMNHQAMPPASTPATASSESVYQVGGNWKDQSDKAFELTRLAGNKQVTAFIYTSCQEVCPIMMKTMKDMQDKLPPDLRAKTHFLVVSFDPKRDTPQVLAKFGEHYKTDDKWTFLSGSDDDIRMLANTMNIRYQFAEGGMINHSNVISVLDEQGKLIEQAIGNSQGEAKIMAALKQPPAMS